MVRERDRDRDRDTQSSRRITNDALKYHDNAMTLPASYGRNKNRRNGNILIQKPNVFSYIPIAVCLPFTNVDMRAQSLDPRCRREFQPGDLGAPVLCNKYAIDQMNRESESRDMRGAQKQPRSKSMPRQHRRGSDLGVYAPPKIVETRAQTLHPPDRNDYHHKNYLSPPIDDEYLEMQTPSRKHHHHKRKEKGLFARFHIVLAGFSMIVTSDLDYISKIAYLIQIHYRKAPAIASHNVADGFCGSSTGEASA